MATERQIEANRKNASLSSGPKTEAGKASSRANALKHGLASENPEVEATRSPAFQTRRDSWAEAYRPVGDVSEWDLDRAVAASFQIERCERAIEVHVEWSSERAKVAWDIDRALDAAKLGSQLARNPNLIARKLESTKHGVNLMIDWWNRLDEPLQLDQDWSESEASTALDLIGVPTQLRSGLTGIDDPEAGPPLAFRRKLVAAEVERLETLRDFALNRLDALERARSMAGDRAMFDAPGKLALRYEREAWQRYRESVGELNFAQRQNELEAKPTPKPTPKPAPAPKPVSTPSSMPMPAPVPAPKPVPVELDDTDFDPRLEMARLIKDFDLSTDPSDLASLFAAANAAFEAAAATGTNPISPSSPANPAMNQPA